MNKAWQIFMNQYTFSLDNNMCFAKKRKRNIKIMQEHVNDNVNQHTFLLFIFERRFFFCRCAVVFELMNETRSILNFHTAARFYS